MSSNYSKRYFNSLKQVDIITFMAECTVTRFSRQKSGMESSLILLTFFKIEIWYGVKFDFVSVLFVRNVSSFNKLASLKTFYFKFNLKLSVQILITIHRKTCIFQKCNDIKSSLSYMVEKGPTFRKFRNVYYGIA